MSVKGIIMFLGMNNTRLERKILIILDFEMVFFLPIYHRVNEAYHIFFSKVFSHNTVFSLAGDQSLAT